MFHHISPTNFSASRNRATRPLLFVAAVLGLPMFCEPELNAATPTTVGYLQQYIPTGICSGSCLIPTSPEIPSSSSLAIQKPAGHYGPFNLPGYADSVYIELSGAVPQLTWQHTKAAELKSTPGGSYRWGVDTNTLAFYNTTANLVTYTITFIFPANNPPNPADLFVVVAGLGCGKTPLQQGAYNLCTGPGGSETTATLVQGATTSAPGTNLGEYTIPSAPYTGTSPTQFNPATLTFSSLYQPGYGDTTDPMNTGWDLYQPPNSANLTTLQLQVTQISGDGIGFTLGYRVCTPLILNGPDFGGYGGMYDLDPTTGTTINFRQTGPLFGMAFSPMSPSGTLYALYQSGAALFPVNPITGMPGTPATTGLSLSGGALAADPTTGILYSLAGSSLVSVSANGQTPVETTIGPVAGLTGSGFYFPPMAFDSSGDLFIVDGLSLLKITAPINASAVGSAKTIGLLPPSMLYAGWAGFTIDPWSGTAYIAVFGVPGLGTNLYTMALTGANPGTLTELGPLTGIAKSVITGLTFIEGACPASTNPGNPIQPIILN